MRFLKLRIKNGFLERVVDFSKSANLIHSEKNSTGKTTFVRAMFYALGYPIPSTRGVRFEKMEFWVTFQNKEKLLEIYRKDSRLTIIDGDETWDFLLPYNFLEVSRMITGCDNKDILENLLGVAYMDQEKGWTLLNRGKVIGNIQFNIEALVRGLGGIQCDEEILRLEAVNLQLKKYEYMYSVAGYQKEISAEGAVNGVEMSEAEDHRLDLLRVEREPILSEIRQIASILRKNKSLVKFLTDMKLSVQAPSGEEIPVTKDTLVGFSDNAELLVTRKRMLETSLLDIERQIESLEKQREEENRLFDVQTAIERFDSDINKIRVNAIAAKHMVERLKRERKDLQEQIRSLTKQDNGVISELHKCISDYAQELDVPEDYVSASRDYIFTNDLKSYSGTILHKIVFAFKMAYVKLVEKKTGLVLPIVLDSPSGREVEHGVVEKMLNIIQRDYSNHQLIVASIYDYDIKEKKMIEFADRLFGLKDIISVDEHNR